MAETQENLERFNKIKFDDSVAAIIGSRITTTRSITRAMAIVDQVISYCEAKIKERLKIYHAPLLHHIEDKIALLEAYTQSHVIYLRFTKGDKRANDLHVLHMCIRFKFITLTNISYAVTFGIEPWGHISSVSVSGKTSEEPPHTAQPVEKLEKLEPSVQ